MNKFKVVLAVVSLMCVNGLAYGEPATNTVNDVATLEQADGKVEVENKQGIYIVENSNFVYERPVEVTVTGVDEKTTVSDHNVHMSPAIMVRASDVTLGKLTLNHNAFLDVNDKTVDFEKNIAGVLVTGSQHGEGPLNSSTTSSAKLTIGDDSNIIVTGNTSGTMDGITAEGLSHKPELSKMEIAVGNGSTIKVTNQNASGGSTHGVQAHQKSSITLGDDIVVDVDSKGHAAGISSTYGAHIKA